MKINQFREYISNPVLEQLPNGMAGATAIEMIVAHESLGCEYVHQVGGPALGIIQMEPFVHDDTWDHCDSIWNNAKSIGLIDDSDYNNKIRPPSERLIYDLRYNVFMARHRLYMDQDPIPVDHRELSEYLKQYWNTSEGGAHQLSYFIHFNKWDNKG